MFDGKDGDAARIEDVLALVERMVAALEGKLIGQAWLTIEEAARHAGVSRSTITDMIRDKRLFVSGKPKLYRIFRQHLDEQIARGWPVLDYVSDAEAARLVLAARPAIEKMPRPKRASAPRKIPRLV